MQAVDLDATCLPLDSAFPSCSLRTGCIDLLVASLQRPKLFSNWLLPSLSDVLTCISVTGFDISLLSPFCLSVFRRTIFFVDQIHHLPPPECNKHASRRFKSLENPRI